MTKFTVKKVTVFRVATQSGLSYVISIRNNTFRLFKFQNR